MKYLLAIDVGNTNTVIGLMINGKVTNSWRVTTGNYQTEDELGIMLLNLLDKSGHSKSSIQIIGISSVVPNITSIFQKVSLKYFGIESFVVSSSLNLGIENYYDDPKSVGADRLCNVIAAQHKYGGPGIVIDFGTATTYDVYDKKGNYLGGNISPGIETSAAALHNRTAKLPRIELNIPNKIVASNTTESMQNGILFGALDAMEGMIKRLSREFDQKPVLTMTGGISHFIIKHTKLKFNMEPDLVLEGIYFISEKINKTK